jgi:uncharacterized membrane protein
VYLFGYDWPSAHAALNDFPAALLFVTVLFDLAAWKTKRASLEAAALWTLWAGVVGGWAAVVAGLQAEDAVEHSEAMHKLMEQHETQALVTMSVFTVVLVYKLWRRSNLKAMERLALRALSVFGFIGILWTGAIGGDLMFEHAAGIPTATLDIEIKDRAQSKHHHHGEGAGADSAGHHGDHDHDEDHEH